MVTRARQPQWPLPAGSRAAGRHRETGRHRDDGQRPAALFLLAGNSGPGETISMMVPGRLGWRQRRAGRHVLARVGRPVLAWIAGVGVLAGFVLLSLNRAGGGRSAATPASAVVHAPFPGSGGRGGSGGTERSGAGSPGSRPAARRRHRPRRMPHRHDTATPSRPAAAPPPVPPPVPLPHPPASPRGPTAAVLVRYFVIGAAHAAFRAEVEVVNNTRQPLASWQIVVALEGDQVTAVQDATGFVSNGDPGG